jgi:hypothetical protein
MLSRMTVSVIFCEPTVDCDGPGFLPRHQTFANQKIGEYVKL